MLSDYEPNTYHLHQRTSHAARCTARALSLSAFLLCLMMSFATESVTARLAVPSALLNAYRA